MGQLVAWYPVAGAYEWPAEARVRFGENMSDARLDGVNHSTHLAQINAEIVRQSRIWNTNGFIYFAEGARLTAAQVTGSQNSVNDIRAARGEAAFAFTSAAVNVDRFLRGYLSELRQALNTNRLRLPLIPHDKKYRRRDSPWPAFLDETALDLFNVSGPYAAGKIGSVWLDPICARERVQLRMEYDPGSALWIPATLPAVVAAEMKFRYASKVTTLEALTLQFYLAAPMGLSDLDTAKDFARLIGDADMALYAPLTDYVIPLYGLSELNAARYEPSRTAILIASANDVNSAGADPNPVGAGKGDSYAGIGGGVNYPTYIDLYV